MPRWTTLPLLAALVLAIGGCAASGGEDSSGDFAGEQQAVAKAVEELQNAGAKGDEQRICRELLTEELARSLATEGRSCEVAVEAALDDSDTFELKVVQGGVRISGDQATARVASDRGDAADQVSSITLAKGAGGTWRLSELGS